MGEDNNCWTRNPKALFSNLNILPTRNMSNAEKLNCMTRLLIVVTIVLCLIGYKDYFVVFIGGIIVIVILSYYMENQKKCKEENFIPQITEKQALRDGVRGFDMDYDSLPHTAPNEPCSFNQDVGLWNMAYEVTPAIQFNHHNDSKRSYMNAKYELTPLTPAEGFTQIWRDEPEYHGYYDMPPNKKTIFPIGDNDVDEPPLSQENYLVRSKVDHLPLISDGFSNLNNVRPYVEQEFSRQNVDFRESMMGEYKDYFRERRQHNCADMPLNRVSAGNGGTL